MDDIDKGQELCLKAGYTIVQDVNLGTPKDNMIYRNYADSGKLKVRLFTMIYVNTPKQALAYAQEYASPHDTTLSDRFKFLGWKLAMDGGFGAKTVLMYDKSMIAASLPLSLLFPGFVESRRADIARYRMSGGRPRVRR